MPRYLYWFVLLLLLPFVLLALFVHPSLDDLSVPLMLRGGQGTRLEIFGQLMQTWNGRYTSNILAVLSPFTWQSLAGHRLLLLIQFPALYFALYYLLGRVLSPVLSIALTRRRLHLLSATLLLLYLHWLPDITESIYWLSGAKVYTWALIVQLMVLGLMADSIEKLMHTKTIILALLLFLSGGFNEIALTINFILAVTYWLLPHYPSSITHYPLPITRYLLPLIAVVLSAFVVLTSEGNDGRMWHFPGGGNLLATFTIAALSTGKLLGVMAQNLPLLLFGFLLLPHLGSNALRPALRPMARLHPLGVACLGLLFLFGAMAVPAWAMGINPPMRIYNFMSLYFMGFFFWGLFSLNHWLRKKEIAFYPAFAGWGRHILILIIFLAMALDFHKQPLPPGYTGKHGTLYTYRGNLPLVTSDLLLRAKPFSKAMKQRQQYVNQQKAAGQTHIVAVPLQNPPSSILFIDITSDSSYWINMLQAEWYGVESIKVRGER